MTRSCAIDYRLVGTGWSTCSIELDAVRVTVSGSYLSDCLAALADAALLLLRGASEARCSFDEEPGEYRWILQHEGTHVRIRILAFPELWGELPDDKGQLILDGKCELPSFAAAMRDALQRVLDEHGLDGYRAMWVEHDFPSAQLSALRELAARLGC